MVITETPDSTKESTSSSLHLFTFEIHQSSRTVTCHGTEMTKTLSFPAYMEKVMIKVWQLRERCNGIEKKIGEMQRLIMLSSMWSMRFKHCNYKTNMIIVISWKVIFWNTWTERFMLPVLVLQVFFCQHILCLPGAAYSAFVWWFARGHHTCVLALNRDCQRGPKVES